MWKQPQLMLKDLLLLFFVDLQMTASRFKSQQRLNKVYMVDDPVDVCIYSVYPLLLSILGWLHPIGIHFTIAMSPPLHIWYLLKTSAAKIPLRMIQCLYSPWKRNSFPGQAIPESQQGDMKQSQACDALPKYPLPFHSHILRFYRESIFPLPPCKVTPSEILHLPSLSLSLAGFLLLWWMSSTLGCLSLSIMPCD